MEANLTVKHGESRKWYHSCCIQEKSIEAVLFSHPVLVSKRYLFCRFVVNVLFCQSLGWRTESKPLCTPHLMDYPQAAGLGDRAEQEDRCRLFSWHKRRFDLTFGCSLVKRRPSYAFETSAPFTAFKYTKASAVLCFAEHSRVQMWKKDARAGVSLSWRELKVCWGEPERRWKCFGKKGNGGWKSTVAETMTTPIIPVIVVAERALYNIIQKYSHVLHSGRGGHTCPICIFSFQVSPHSCIQQLATWPQRGDYSSAPMIRKQAAVGVCGPINTNW